MKRRELLDKIDNRINLSRFGMSSDIQLLVDLYLDDIEQGIYDAKVKLGISKIDELDQIEEAVDLLDKVIEDVS